MGDFDDFIDGMYPYRREFPNYRRIPDEPVGRPEIYQEIAGMAGREDAIGDQGRVSGSLYSGDHEHYAYLGEVFSTFSHANVLQRDMYPSATKFEAEIVAMALDLVNGPEAGSDACGVVTGGGSESLISALYAYREAARTERGVTRPNVVLPTTAHVALDKGAHWMNIEVRHSPLQADYRADVAAMADLIDDQTIGWKLPVRVDRPDRGNRRIGIEPGNRLPCGRLPGRFPLALGGGTGVRRAGLGLPRAGCDVDLGGHP